MNTAVGPKRQTQKVGKAGSFINQMMGNNQTLPEAGQYATIMYYTDRKVAFVKEVKDNGVVVMQYCSTSADRSKGNLTEGHQEWIHTPMEGTEYELTWFRGKWRIVRTQIKFVDKSMSWHRLREEHPDVYTEIYSDDTGWPCKEVAGFTKMQKIYQPVSIIFGKSDYYYDWSF